MNNSIILGAAGFASGAAAVCLIFTLYIKVSNKVQKRPQSRANRPAERIGTMDIILVFIGVFLLAFTAEMVVLFEKYQDIPDTLVTCVFAALGGECGVMGWIRTTKDKSQERRWMKEDENNKDTSGNSDE